MFKPCKLSATLTEDHTPDKFKSELHIEITLDLF